MEQPGAAWGLVEASELIFGDPATGAQTVRVRGEYIRSRSTDAWVRAGQVRMVPDSEARQAVVCVCGRRFVSMDHPHFLSQGHEPRARATAGGPQGGEASRDE